MIIQSQIIIIVDHPIQILADTYDLTNQVHLQVFL